MHTLALFQGIGHWELLIILAIGLLLFGRRLPEVGRSLGKGIVEFKRGIKGIEDEIETTSDRPDTPASPDALPKASPASGSVSTEAREPEAMPREQNG